MLLVILNMCKSVEKYAWIYFEMLRCMNLWCGREVSCWCPSHRSVHCKPFMKSCIAICEESNVILTCALKLTSLFSAEILVRTHLTLNHSRPGWMRLHKPSRHCETSIPISNFACNYWLHWYLKILELDIDFETLSAKLEFAGYLRMATS